MSAFGTMVLAAGMACGAVFANRALFARNRRRAAPSPDVPKPFSDDWMRQEARDFAHHRNGSAPLPASQTDESRLWHLSRAEERRIRRAYRKMRLDIESRLDNPAWKHSATGRSL
jgi:hypothetical protein